MPITHKHPNTYKTRNRKNILTYHKNQDPYFFIVFLQFLHCVCDVIVVEILDFFFCRKSKKKKETYFYTNLKFMGWNLWKNENGWFFKCGVYEKLNFFQVCEVEFLGVFLGVLWRLKNMFMMMMNVDDDEEDSWTRCWRWIF
jgi:hypothetical protein